MFLFSDEQHDIILKTSSSLVLGDVCRSASAALFIHIYEFTRIYDDILSKRALVSFVSSHFAEIEIRPNSTGTSSS